MRKLIGSRDGLLRPLELIAFAGAIACAVVILTLPSAEFADPAIAESKRELTIQLRKSDWCAENAEQSDCNRPTFRQVFARYKIPKGAQTATLAHYGDRKSCANPDLPRGFGEEIKIVFPSADEGDSDRKCKNS